MKTNLPKRYLTALALITFFNLLVLVIRDIVVGNSAYNFLIWNLFLGFVPLAFAGALQYFFDRLSKFWILAGTFLWLLFYPNAPYMISDLIHVHSGSSTVLYDTLIIFSFAMLSLFYGFSSMKIIHRIYRGFASNRIAHLVIGVSLLLSSFGIYLGRVLRFNSWDIFSDPMKVIHAIFEHLFPISKNPETYVVIIIFSALQYMILIMMRDVEEIEENHLISGDTSE